MNELEVLDLFEAKLAELVREVELDDEEIQEKFAMDTLGGVIAGRSYFETIDAVQ